MLGRQEGRRRSGQQMVGWHHQLNGREFAQTLRDGEGQGSLVCYRLSGHDELDTTSPPDNNDIAINTNALSCGKKEHSQIESQNRT